MSSSAAHPYRGRCGGLATQHDKLPLIAPALDRHTGLAVVQVAVDTDRFGTFSGEVQRPANQWATAVAKAREAIAESGHAIGLGSEGSFGPLDGAPFVQADHELVVLVDIGLGIEVGEFDIEVGVPRIGVDVEADRVDLVPLDRAAFPEHGLIVRPSGGWEVVVKGIHDATELRAAMLRCGAASADGRVRVESDLRAHHHPSRRSVIARAAERLAARLAVMCPSCSAPGFGVVRRVAGAPCIECRTPTRLVASEVLGCAACSTEVARSTANAVGVDPRYCPFCNP